MLRRLMPECAPGEPNVEGAGAHRLRLVYLIDGKQLTKDVEGRRVVISNGEGHRARGWSYGKTFSHRRSEFPSQRFDGGVGINQGPGEFQTYQVVTFPVLHPPNPCTQ